MCILTSILFFCFSCSKDSDLLSDYVLAENKQIYQLVVNDSYSFQSPGGSVVLDVLQNDNFVEGQNVNIIEASNPQNGQVQINEDNTVTYTPEVEGDVTDTFTYTTEVIDEDENTVEETGNVTVSIQTPESLDVKNDPRVVFDNGFEGGSSDWVSNNGAWKPESLNANIIGNAREGSNAIQFLPEPNDVRSEIITRSSDGFFDWYQEYWLGFSIKVVSEVTGYRIAMQHHAVPSGNAWNNSAGQNGFSIRTTGGNLDFMTSTDTDFTFRKNPPSGAIDSQVSHIEPYVLNQWHDVVMHFKYSENNDGYIEIWMDGTKIVDIQNNSTVYFYDVDGDPKFPRDYLKLGLYHGPNDGGEIHYDAVRILEGSGGSYEDVAPRN